MPMRSSGRILTPSVSSSKNLSKPALAAGIGPWSCFFLRLTVFSLVNTLEYSNSLFNVVHWPPPKVFGKTSIQLEKLGFAVYKSINETHDFEPNRPSRSESDSVKFKT
jgi:hypothetical protein